MPVGLAVGATAWLVAARPPGAVTLASLSERAAAVEARRDAPRLIRPDGIVATALATPLFALTTGPGAVAEGAIRLEGLVRLPGRVAALLAIGSAPSSWLELGQTRDGVTLQEVSPSKVVVDTAVGLKEIGLGVVSAPADPATPPPPDTAARAPSGFKMPIPPASAPGQPR
jgi:hypothetical protein